MADEPVSSARATGPADDQAKERHRIRKAALTETGSIAEPTSTTRSTREEAHGYDAVTLRGRRSGKEELLPKSETP